MNFTWLASAYDVDDTGYRLAVCVQITGVLVLAAGVPAAFDGDFRAITLGYALMRVGLVSLWLRVSLDHPAGRRTALRYAAGVSFLQVVWLSELAVPGAGSLTVFAVLALLEMGVPVLAERAGPTPWHPGHIAERYGLFVIIVLGEGLLAATTAVDDAVAHGMSADLGVVAVSGLIMVVGLWWLYFAVPSGAGLERRRAWSFVWGYGHFFVLAALAALGAGLEVAVHATGGGGPNARAVVAGVAAPIAVFVVTLALLHRTLSQPEPLPMPLVASGVAVLTIAVAVAPSLGTTPALVLIAASVVGMVYGRSASLAGQRLRARRRRGRFRTLWRRAR
jgi:low temperature requirement protein LtrA